MWITIILTRKHSLSTCGQTVHDSGQVIHINPKLSTTHLVLSSVFVIVDRFGAA